MKRVVFTLVLCFALCGLNHFARANEQSHVSCSPFKAIYIPSSPYKKRDDGIHYSMTLEDDKCAGGACVSAKVHLNTYDATDTLLTRLTMRYECAGTGWVCTVSLLCSTCNGKNSDHILFDPVALTSGFERIDFLGRKDNAAYALILPAINHRFRYAPWDKFKGSVEVFTQKKLPLEIAVHLNTPEVWVLSKCDH